MSMQDGYLDRMAARIAEFERALRGSSAEQLDDRRRRDLEAGLATVKERFQALRRARAEVTDEMLQSFTAELRASSRGLRRGPRRGSVSVSFMRR